MKLFKKIRLSRSWGDRFILYRAKAIAIRPHIMFLGDYRYADLHRKVAKSPSKDLINALKPLDSIITSDLPKYIYVSVFKELLKILRYL